MRLPYVRFTVRQMMAAVLLAGGLSWFTSCVWNREYSETAFFWGEPATRASYTRTYGDWVLERLGMGTRHYRNWTPIPEPPPPVELLDLKIESLIEYTPPPEPLEPPLKP